MARSNCASSGFTVTPYAVGFYALDVNIDTGPFGVGPNTFLSIVQDLFVVPIWSGLLWAVHGLLALIEWGYSLDLTTGSTLGSVASALHRTQLLFTDPWLAFVLAIAASLAVYNGLVRRRVAETLGQAVLTVALILGGLWVIADPLATIGTLSGWSSQASLGTLSAVADGTADNTPRTLAESMRGVFTTAIGAPWCYLEFGRVHWCEAPSSLERPLRATAAKAAITPRQRLLVRQAATNGALFLAFPANGLARNSYKQEDSLLHAICRASSASACNGSTAAEARFRSNEGTFARMVGVLCVAAGLLGMIALFGFIATRLLGASLASILLLLLAPAAVLAPALGDRARAAFISWAGRLLGALVSKLLYSFVLGTLLFAQRMLIGLQLGWWTQWLLLSVLWWGAFLERHKWLNLLYARGGSRHRLRVPRQGRTVAPLQLLALARFGARPVERALGAPGSVNETLSAPTPYSAMPPTTQASSQPLTAQESLIEAPPVDAPTTDPSNSDPPTEKPNRKSSHASRPESPVIADARAFVEGKKPRLGVL